MMLAAGSDSGSAISLQLIEGGLTAIAVAFAFCWPTLGANFFRRVELAFGTLAKRRSWAVAIVGLSAFCLRLALLPLCPIPNPFVPDDFSFLLAANTFAQGRLANPTPAMWTHFESMHISMQPAYMSMYFPAQGMILAAGKLLTGNPWFGLLCITALMCAAICWMLQAWLPPTWALLGGIIAVLHLSLFSYWINTYSGAGSLAALGGTLVLGALPRILRRARMRDAMLLAIGVVIVALTRPYEGVLLCIPVFFVLFRWMFFAKNRPAPNRLIRLWAAPLALIIAAGLWLGYYDAKVNGHPLTLPYTLNRATYAVAPYWMWQSPRPEPAYRHKVMRDFYTDFELDYVHQIQHPSGFAFQLAFKPFVIALFFAGIALLPPLIWWPRALFDRRIRFFAGAACVWIPGMLLQIFLLPHYVAVFTGAFYCIGLQAMRHMRVRRFEARPVGLALARFLVIVCIMMAALRAWAEPLGLRYAVWPSASWNFDWYGPGHYGTARASVEKALESMPGKQLVLVRYCPSHWAADEWVYNAPDIDSSQVLWAREMGTADNLELMRHYSDRKAWLVQPDLHPGAATPYAAAEQATTAAVCPTVLASAR